MPIEIDFDFKIVVTSPFLTKSLSRSVRERLTASGEFTFTEPKQVEVRLSAAEPASQLEGPDVTDSLKIQLDETLGKMDNLASIIDSRCKHIIVTYDPNKKSDEAIAEACLKIFGEATGQITYKMYVEVIKYLQKLDKFLAHKSVENEGVI